MQSPAMAPPGIHRTPALIRPSRVYGATSFFSSEISFQVAAQAVSAGFVKFAIMQNLGLGIAKIASAGTGCPPATSCVGPFTINLNDTLILAGILFDCNGNALNWGFSGMEGKTVIVHTGACGDAGADNILGSGQTQLMNGFTPWGISILSVGFVFQIPVTSVLINYVNAQKTAGHRASMYIEVRP